MDNQHRKISNYRELSQEEVDLMNEIKAKEAELRELINRVEEKQVFNPDLDPQQQDDASRAIKVARDNLQTGFMWFVRAVALPDGGL